MPKQTLLERRPAKQCSSVRDARRGSLQPPTNAPRNAEASQKLQTRGQRVLFSLGFSHGRLESLGLPRRPIGPSGRSGKKRTPRSLVKPFFGRRRRSPPGTTRRIEKGQATGASGGGRARGARAGGEEAGRQQESGKQRGEGTEKTPTNTAIPRN